jgi:hypothetical protein
LPAPHGKFSWSAQLADELASMSYPGLDPRGHTGALVSRTACREFPQVICALGARVEDGAFSKPTTGGAMNGSSSDTAHGTLVRADAFQRQHTPVAVPVAVLRKFSEDQSANLASMIAFWAFFSIFPCPGVHHPCSGSSSRPASSWTC